MPTYRVFRKYNSGVYSANKNPLYQLSLSQRRCHIEELQRKQIQINIFAATNLHDNVQKRMTNSSVNTNMYKFNEILM